MFFSYCYGHSQQAHLSLNCTRETLIDDDILFLYVFLFCFLGGWGSVGGECSSNSILFNYLLFYLFI